MIIYDVLKDILINLLVFFTINFYWNMQLRESTLTALLDISSFCVIIFFLLLNDSWEYIVASQYKQLYTLMQL